MIIGILLIPFIQFFVREPVGNIYLYYSIYLVTTVMSYFISYKDALLIADQNLYQSNIIVGVTYVIMYILRIIFLIILPDFVIYCMIQLIMLLIQRILINRYITKKYSHISFDSKDELSTEEKNEITKGTFSIFLNKLGNYLVNGTDNIIISAIPKLGLGTVTIYTNYYSVLGAVDNIIYKGISGITASFGDLAVNESKKVQENVYNIIMFANFFICGLLTIGFYFLLSDFITLCFGKAFFINNKTLLIICFNFYLAQVLKSLDSIKEATGNYIKDKYANLLQALINVVLSIILGMKFGLIGVVSATLLSYIIVPLWNRPYLTYKYTFEKSPKHFYYQNFIYFISLILVFVLMYYIIPFINVGNILMNIILRGIVIVMVYTIIILVIYRNKKECEFFINKIKKSN